MKHRPAARRASLPLVLALAMAAGAMILLFRTPNLMHGGQGPDEVLYQGQDLSLTGER
jgi:hypothetical protein